MERRFFGFLVHLLGTLTVVTAGRLLKPYNPSRVVKTRQEYGSEPIRLELKATNTDNKDLGILLETILDVKDFVRLVHVIAVNHLDGTDLRDVHDTRSNEEPNYHESYSLLETKEDESDPKKSLFTNDDPLVEYEIRQELLAVSSNLRRQPETLNALTRHFTDIIRNLLTRILADLKNQLDNKRKFKTPTIKRRETRIEEIAKVLGETIALLRTRPRKEKPIDNQTPNLWGIDFSRQLTNLDTDIDPLSILYVETKILQRLVLENSALCRLCRHQERNPDKKELVDLNEAFEFFINPEHLKIAEKLQECLKVVLERIIKNYSEKSDNQLPVDYQEQKGTTEGIETNETSIDFEDNDKNVTSRQPRLHKIQNDEISTNDQNRMHDNEQVTVSHSKNTASQKSMDGNVNVPELQTSTDSDSLKNSHEVLPTRMTIKDFEEERITTEEGISEIGKQESPSVNVSTVSEKVTMSNPKTVNKIEVKRSEENIITDSIIDTPESEVNETVKNEKNQNKNATDRSINNIRNEENERKIEDQNVTDLSVDSIVTESIENVITNKMVPSMETSVNEVTENKSLIGGYVNNTSNSSVESVDNEKNEKKTGNKSISEPSVNLIETVVNEENDKNIRNESISDPSVDPIVTERYENNNANNTTDTSIKVVINEENDKNTRNESISDPSVDLIVTERYENNTANNTTDPPIEIFINEANEKKTRNYSITDPVSGPIETDEYENNTANTVTDPSTDIFHKIQNEEQFGSNETIHLSIKPNGNEENIDNTFGPLNFTTINGNREEQNDSNSIEDLSTTRNLKKIHFGNSENKNTEYTENKSLETNELVPHESSSKYNKNDSGSSTMTNNTNINIIPIPLRSRKNKTRERSEMEEPDVVTTMRFGSDDWYNPKTRRINSTTATGTNETQLLNRKSKAIALNSSSNCSETSPEKEIKLPLNKIDHPLTELVEPPRGIISNETIIKSNANDSQIVENVEERVITSERSRKSLGSSDISHLAEVDNEMKKYIITVILDAINLILRENSTNRIQQTDQKKTLRDC